MPEQPTRDAELVRLANQFMVEEQWFHDLPDSMKDELSQPNHDHSQAKRGLHLAVLILTAAGGCTNG